MANWFWFAPKKFWFTQKRLVSILIYLACYNGLRKLEKVKHKGAL